MIYAYIFLGLFIISFSITIGAYISQKIRKKKRHFNKVIGTYRAVLYEDGKYRIEQACQNHNRWSNYDIYWDKFSAWSYPTLEEVFKEIKKLDDYRINYTKSNRRVSEHYLEQPMDRDDLLMKLGEACLTKNEILEKHLLLMLDKMDS